MLAGAVINTRTVERHRNGEPKMEISKVKFQMTFVCLELNYSGMLAKGQMCKSKGRIVKAFP